MDAGAVNVKVGPASALSLKEIVTTVIPSEVCSDAQRTRKRNRGTCCSAGIGNKAGSSTARVCSPRSPFRSARNDNELKLTMANRDKNRNSKSADRTLTLTAAERRVLIEALLDPPKPNEKAIAAARRLKEEMP